MLRTLHRPSPAFGISLIALFVALGGTSYGLATGSIDSREIKNNSVATNDVRNNSVRGKDVRDGALTGADIRESTLATVPTATSAVNAARSSTAQSSTTAETAANATKLAGIAASGFERAGRVEAGSGSYTSTTQQRLLAWPELGFELYTDGDADIDHQLRLKNTRTDGAMTCVYGAGGLQCNSSSVVQTVNLGADPFAEFLVFPKDNTAVAEWVKCASVFTTDEVVCYGTRTRAGSRPEGH